jgi:hypothetical protein
MKGLDLYLDRQWHEYHDAECAWDGTCEVDNAVFRTADAVYKMTGVMRDADDIAEFHFWRLDIHGLWMDADEEIGCGETPALDAAYAAAAKLYADCEVDSPSREGAHDEY